MDDVSFELLRLYSQRNKLSIKEIAAICNQDVRIVAEPVLYLADMKYLRKYEGNNKTGMFDTAYMITHAGHITLEAEQKSRKQFKYNELRAWITLAISVMALIISVISLLLQIL